MRQKYCNQDKQKLLDLIIDTAILIHESRIQVAEKLGVPSDIVSDLRWRSPRCAMISPCSCEECTKGRIASTISYTSIKKNEISEDLLKWIASGDRGASSETIVTKLAGIDLAHGCSCEPHDPSDFRRCLLLLDAVPELKSKLDKMKEVSNYWRLLIENWNELEKMYHEEKSSGRAPKLYEKMKLLRREAQAG